MEEPLTYLDRVAAYAIIDYVKDLGDTCSAILERMPKEKKTGLPNQQVLDFGLAFVNKHVVDYLDRDKKILKHDNIQAKIKEDTADGSWDFPAFIFRQLRDGWTPEIQKFIEKRDEKYFIENMDDLTKDAPVGNYGDIFSQLKKFVCKENLVDEEDMDIIWDYFEDIGNTVLDYKQLLPKAFPNDEKLLKL